MSNPISRAEAALFPYYIKAHKLGEWAGQFQLVSELLTDLRHHAKAFGLDFDAAVSQSETNFIQEDEEYANKKEDENRKAYSGWGP